MDLKFFWKIIIKAGRIKSPAATILAIAPTLIGYLKNNSSVSYFLIAILSFASFFGRTAGCIYNEFVDQKIDKHVERSKKRIFALKNISFKSILPLGISAAIITLILYHFLNLQAILIASLTIFIALIYPFTKRFFPIPQLFLAVAYPAGALVGWVMQGKGLISTTPWIIYFCTMHWVATFDTIYAYQDYEGDIKQNLKSSAVLLGKKYGKLGILYGWAKTCTLYYFIGNFYALISLIAFGMIMLIDLNLTKPISCRKWFIYQQYAAIIMLLGVI